MGATHHLQHEHNLPPGSPLGFVAYICSLGICVTRMPASPPLWMVSSGCAPPLFVLSLPLLDFVVDQTQAVKFALDIARGMAFLHTLEPLIPRHYLNSRSIMVSIRVGHLRPPRAGGV